MKKRKNRVRLPSVTILTYNRADLLRFAEAVEALRGLVIDLRVIVDAMKRKKAPALPPIPSALPEVPT
jgi:hypothetical protein